MPNKQINKEKQLCLPVLEVHVLYRHLQLFAAPPREPGSPRAALAGAWGSPTHAAPRSQGQEQAGTGSHEQSRALRGRSRQAPVQQWGPVHWQPGQGQLQSGAPLGLHCWAEAGPGHPCLTRKDDRTVKAERPFCSMTQVLCD